MDKDNELLSVSGKILICCPVKGKEFGFISIAMSLRLLILSAILPVTSAT